MKNCDLQRRLLPKTLNPVDALNQAITYEKGYYNHLKLMNMTRSSIGSSGRVYKNFNTVKKEPSLNIEKSSTCMKCGNAFPKGHLNACRRRKKFVTSVNTKDTLEDYVNLKEEGQL